MKAIGLTFAKELNAAGLAGLAISWGEGGNIDFADSITAAQRAAVLAVYQKHNAEASLADLKTAKKAEITQSFNATMQQVVGDTPSYEIDSWGKQEAQARAFIAAPTALTPLIDALATTRGVPKAELAARIIVKADLFEPILGALMGKRQGLEDAIDAATTKAALAAINW